MALDYEGIDITLLAAEDLSSYQYHFVTQANDTTVQLLNAATDAPLGVLQNAPAAGQPAVVRIAGVSKLKANAAIAVGVQVKAEYVGAADCGKADAADTEGDIARGLVVQASGAEDDLCAALLIYNEQSVPV